MTETLSRDHLVTSVDQLERIYGQPYGPSMVKEADRITAPYRAFIEAALRAHLDAQVGRTRRVLVELSGVVGRTEHFTQVRLAAPIEPGVIVDLVVAGHDGRQLLAA